MNAPSSVVRLAFLALLGGATGIGFAPVLVRLSETGPAATAFFRLLMALPFLWLWMRREQRALPQARQPATRRDFLSLTMAGLFFVADLSIWHWSLQLTSVATSTLLTNFAPLFVTLGAWLFLGERISAVFLLGMALAFSGAALLLGADLRLERKYLVGDALAVVAAVFYAGYLLSLKYLRRQFSTATIMAWVGVVACPGFLLVAVVSGDRLLPAGAQGWVVLAALALISHVGGQTLITYAIGHLPAAFSSLSLLLQPVVAALLAWAILSEPLGGLQWIGGAVVLAGIALASRGNE